MLAQIDHILQERCFLDHNQLTLVAVSGGPDSLCLLDLLGELSYPLIVAHLDHSLRPESREEAEVVRKLAVKMGKKFILGKEDVQQFAITNQLSLEEAAREMRYRFLFRIAEQNAVQAVAVGHNADDQVETVLMHLLRGAGLPGLRGMSFYGLPNPWSQQIPLIRPLLGTWREEILDYVSVRGLSPVMDASNLDTQFYRNRLRHELIPYLEDYNPGVRQRLWQMADVLGEEDNLIQKMVDQAWKVCVQEETPAYIAFDLRTLAVQASGVQRRLLRRAIQQLRPGMRNLDYRAITLAQSFIHTPSSSSKINLIANLRLQQEAEKLWLADWDVSLPEENWPQVCQVMPIKLSIPGEIELSDNWVLQAEILKHSAVALDLIQNNPNPYLAWLDLETLELPIMVRNRRPGDRFQPLGMGGKSMKVADYMLNTKLARRARAGWPLVFSKDQIAWVPGYQVGEPYRVHDGTKNVLRLSLQRKQ